MEEIREEEFAPIERDAHTAERLAFFDEREIPDALFFDDLDPDRPALQPILAAWRAGRRDEAVHLLAEHFRGRRDVRWTFDARDAVDPAAPTRWDGNLQHYLDDILRNRFEDRTAGFSHEMGANMECVAPPWSWSQSWSTIVHSRHYPLRALAEAYSGAHNPKYAAKAGQYVEAWLTQVPFLVKPDIVPGSYYISRKPPQEAMSLGTRMQNWTDLLYSGIAARLPDELVFRMIRAMWFIMLQYRRFDSNTYFRGNHHLYERGYMPIVFGTTYPEFLSFRSFLKTGPAVVKRHIQAAIGPDFGGTEHSVAYGSNDFWWIKVVGDRNGFTFLSEAEVERIRRALICSLHALTPDGKMLPFGDAEGSGRLDRAVRAGLPEGKGVARALGLPASVPPAVLEAMAERLPSLIGSYPNMGFVFARNAWAPEATVLGLAIPQPGVYFHGHLDLLSVLVHMGGRRVLWHPTVEWYPDSEHPVLSRTVYRGRYYNMTTQNCLLVHGHPVLPDEAVPASAKTPAPCVLERADGTDRATVLRAWHEAYGFVRHTREVILLQGGLVAIRDILAPIAGKEPADFGRCYPPGRPPLHTQRWHLDFGVTAQKVSDAAVVVRNRNRCFLLAWDAKEIRGVAVLPIGFPNPAARKDEPLPLTVEACFGPETDAGATLVLLPLREGEAVEAGQARAQSLREEAIEERTRGA